GMPAGGVHGRQFAGRRGLLLECSDGSEHHRFRAPGFGFVECLLRTFSLLGLRQAELVASAVAGLLRRDQSGGGIERHVLSERAVAVYSYTVSVPRGQRRQPDEARAAVGPGDFLHALPLSLQPESRTAAEETIR